MSAVEQGSIARIGELIRTQDNHITSHPVFVVEQQRTTYAVDTDYDNDGFEWLDDDGIVHPRKAARLERLFQAGGNTAGYRRLGYKHHWEFVTACFTWQGCEDYLAVNGHNLSKTRIFVYSGWRNAEWQALREHLVATPPQVSGGGGVIESLAAIKRAAARTPHREDRLALYAAHAALSTPQARPTIRVQKLGMYGAAYDGPEDKRAYTYTHQPANGPAYSLGHALSCAAIRQGGDFIDGGLSLLKELEAKGFGVFEIADLPAPSVQARPDGWDAQAYSNMRDDLESWKQRALTAEAEMNRLCEQFNAENGPTHMGEPVLPQLVEQAPPDGGEYEAAFATADRLEKPPATERCDFCGANAGDLHAFDCTALDTHPAPASDAANGVPITPITPDVALDAEPMFYIQDTRGYVGNCPLWWRPDGKGYTTRLDEAGKYTGPKAMKQHQSRETDVPWPCDAIDALIRPTVDMQDMRRLAPFTAAQQEADRG